MAEMCSICGKAIKNGHRYIVRDEVITVYNKSASPNVHSHISLCNVCNSALKDVVEDMSYGCRKKES